MHWCACSSVRVCMCSCICVSVYVRRTCMRVYVCVCVCMRVCVCVCVCVYVSVCLYVCFFALSYIFCACNCRVCPPHMWGALQFVLVTPKLFLSVNTSLLTLTNTRSDTYCSPQTINSLYLELGRINMSQWCLAPIVILLISQTQRVHVCHFSIPNL